MQSFEFTGLSTRVILAPGAAGRVAGQVDQLGGTRVMLVCGGRTAGSDLTATVKAALGARLAVVYDSIVEHSSTQSVEAGARVAARERVDLLLAVGGGSASDTAKAIAIVLAEGEPLRQHASSFVPPDRYLPRDLPNPKLPLIVIPTTLSAAEVTPGLGVRDEVDERKLLFWDIKLAPRVIVLDPAANLEVPVSVMATTGMNAVAHCVEGLYSKMRNPISEGLALQGLRLLHDALPTMVALPQDADLRAQALVGAHLSGMVIANARVGIHHAICHCLGAKGGLAHGVANSVMLPHAMRYNLEAAAAPLRLVAEALRVDVRGLSDAQAARHAIEAIEALQEAIGVPRRLRDTTLRRSQLRAVAEHTLSDRGLYFNPRTTRSADAVAELLEAAW